MILGFTVILGTIGLYVISLVVRLRSSRRDLAMLESVEPRLRE
jgi:hypothetical protein